jgi:hypothetical protein
LGTKWGEKANGERYKASGAGIYKSEAIHPAPVPHPANQPVIIPALVFYQLRVISTSSSLG